MRDEIDTLFHDASAPPMSVDPYAVVAGGRRLGRRRRLTAVAGTVAATLALGVGGWAVLAQQGGSDDRTLPASNPASGTVDGASTTLDLHPGAPWPDAPDLPTSIVVSLDPRNGVVDYTYTRTTSSPDDPPAPVIAVEQTPVPSSGDAPMWKAVDGVPALAGIVPARAVGVHPVWAGTGPTAVVRVRPLAGTDWSAFALYWDPAETDVRLADLLWSDGEAVHGGAGVPLPSGTLDGISVYVDRTGGVFGWITLAGGEGASGAAGTGADAATKRLDEVPAGHQPVVALGTTEGALDPMTTTFVMLLPAGASEVTPEPADGVAVLTEGVVDLGTSGERALVARLSGPHDMKGTGITSVTWTSPDGTTESAPGS